jgi:hypothetical protein
MPPEGVATAGRRGNFAAVAAWPTTVTRSRCPRTFGRRAEAVLGIVEGNKRGSAAGLRRQEAVSRTPLPGHRMARFGNQPARTPIRAPMCTAPRSRTPTGSLARSVSRRRGSEPAIDASAWRPGEVAASAVGAPSPRCPSAYKATPRIERRSQKPFSLDCSMTIGLTVPLRPDAERKPETIRA